MAYAFNAIDDLVNGQQQNQNNIFAPGQDPATQNQVAQTNPDVKTSTEGEIGGGGSGVSSSSGSASQSSQSTQQGTGTDTSQVQANKAAFKANVGKTEQPKVFQDIGGQLAANQKQLQDEANSYTTTQKAKQNYAVGNDDLEKAIGGDQDKWSSVRGLMNQTTINPVDEFKPSDIDVKDANNLNTNAGLKSLISRGQDPNFTSGMAAFDLASLRKTPGFTNQVAGLQGQSTALQKQLSDLTTSEPKDIQDYGTQQLAAAQAAARGYLGNQSDLMDQQNAKEAQAANAHLQELKKSGDPALSKAFLDSLTQDVKGRVAQLDPQAADLVDAGSIDPLKYQQVHGDYTANDFISPDEAKRFNSIMGLLGSGRAYTASGALGDDVTYDRDAASNALMASTLKARDTQKTQAQSDIDKLLAQAQAQADADDARRAGLNVDTTARSLAAKALQGDDAKDINDMLGASNSLTGVGQLPQGFDPTKYYTPDKSDLGAQDVLTKDQADQLNKYAKLLGSQTVYKAGANTTPSSGTLDKNRMFQDLRAMLSAQAAQKQLAAAQAAAAKRAQIQQGLDNYGAVVDGGQVYTR